MDWSKVIVVADYSWVKKAEAEAELDQLRERIRQDVKLNMELMEIRRENEAEIERLREELAVEKGWVSQYRDSYCKHVAEIELLRGFLRVCYEECIPHDWVDFRRRVSEKLYTKKG